MHTLIDKQSVESINNTGCFTPDYPDRKLVLEEHNLPYDREAENVIVTGCEPLPLLPNVLVALARFFDKQNFSYTFLSKEYCCGNYLYRPAIKARDEDAMAECRDLSRGFVEKNLQSARKLGAKRLVIFCSPCYPIYKHAFPDEDIIFYPEAIAEVMGEMEFNEKVDYYAGCYKLHKRFAPAPMDLKSTNQVFKKISGLEINRIKAPICCYKPDGLSHMIDNVQTKNMLHICTGCYGQAIQFMPKEKDVNIMMLPEFVEMLDNPKKT